MNTPRQIAHILRKDIHGHMLEIGFLLLLHIAFVLVATESWLDITASEGSLFRGTTELVLQIAIVVIWALLIVQVVHAETATGKSAYWLTRPLSRLAVPSAKAGFVLLVVHLPSFAAQMAIVAFSGVPLSVGRLLVNQLVFLVYWSVPVMLIASLTRSLSQFVLAVLIFGAAVLMMQSGIDGRANLTGAVDLLDPIPVEIAAWMMMLAVVAGGAVFWHYRKRQTLIVATSCASAILLLYLVTAAFPRTVEHWGRSLLQGAPAISPSISFRPAAERPGRNEVASVPIPGPIPVVRVSLPLEVSDTEGIRLARTLVRIRTLTDPEQEFESLGSGWLLPGTSGYWFNFDVPQRFSNAEVSVRIEISFEPYESYDSDAIPLDGRPGLVDGRLQCGVVAVPARESGYVLCRSSVDLAGGFLDWSRRVASITDSYVPFRISMNPILNERLGSFPLPVRDSATPLATQMRVPSGYARLIVEIDRVRLQDWVPEQTSPALP